MFLHSLRKTKGNKVHNHTKTLIHYCINQVIKGSLTKSNNHLILYEIVNRNYAQ